VSAFSNTRSTIDPSKILEDSLKKVCFRVLTNLQKRILLYIIENEKREATLSRQAKEIARKMKIPEPTVKWNLRVLRDLNLIECGSINNKGIPIRLTYAGLIIANSIKEEIK
jgi:DNA-binding MarR family transcriptional regulator